MTFSVKAWSRERPLLLLSLLFVVWKSVILAIAILSPGIGYDTSTNLLLHFHTRNDIQIGISETPASVSKKLFNFVRWDAIYFTQMAQRGIIFEQEWAWGKGWSTVMASAARLIPILHNTDGVERYAIAGIILSHICHWLSVVLLFLISKTLLLGTDKNTPVPFVAATLHIISPAGIFLSAPYAESTFSFLNMFGFYLYLNSKSEAETEAGQWRLVFKLLAGTVFGCATLIRSNGILGGIPFLLDAITVIRNILDTKIDPAMKPSMLVDLQFTFIGGGTIAAGMMVPQYLAYQEYCVRADLPRPWCSATLPLISSFVQSHYWNVGLFRYWTVSNIPLFLLAIPVLYLLIRSGIEGCWSSRPRSKSLMADIAPKISLALPQLILAILALTTYHVQIVTRLASGYPYWYVWLASRIGASEPSQALTRTMAMYALVQASLFASFLPPA